MIGKKIPVALVQENGGVIIYESQRECARSIGVSVVAVNKVIVGVRESTKGHTIRLATGDEIYEWEKTRPKRLDREEWKGLAKQLCIAVESGDASTLANLMDLVEGSI